MNIKTFAPAALAAAALVTGIAMQPATARDKGIQLGQLRCDVAGGLGFIFGSSKDLTCTFTPANESQPKETYTGTINKFGIDIGITGKSVILWTVVAAEGHKYDPGALAGTYGGATASAAFAAGLGANALIGGSSKSVALQPVSISASEGVNVAVGLAQVELK
jgi:hypothetical protein